MVDDGYEDVVNIDISSVVIEAMLNKYQDRSQLKCILYLSWFNFWVLSEALGYESWLNILYINIRISTNGATFFSFQRGIYWFSILSLAGA